MPVDPERLAAYQAKVAAIQARGDRLADAEVRRVFDLLADVRRKTIEELTSLSANGNAGTFEAYQLGQLRTAIDNQADELRAQYGTALAGGLQRGWDFGLDKGPETMKAAGVGYTPQREISVQQLRMAQEVAADLVTKVSDQFRSEAKGVITRGLMGQQSPHQIIQQVAALLRTQPDRDGKLGSIAYQAERIVRTEVLGVASLAGQIRSEQIADEVPGMRKYWLHSRARVPRPAHVAAGNRYAPGGSIGPIPVKDDYTVDGEKAKAPHDPRMSAGNRVLCGCDSVLYNPAWFEVEATEVQPKALAAEDRFSAKPPRGLKALTALQNRFMRRGQNVNDHTVRGNAKRDLERTLVDRFWDNTEHREFWLKHVAEFSDARTTWIQKLQADPVKYAEDLKQELELHIKSKINNWAHTSGDSGEEAIAMQLAAKKVFGLPDSSIAHLKKAGNAYTLAEDYASSVRGEFDQRFLQTMYDQTQAELKAAGIKQVYVYRGVQYDAKNLPGRLPLARERKL